MTDEQLSDLERACCDHLLSWLRGLTNAREFWYLVALEQEHAASREALQMMQHVARTPEEDARWRATAAAAHARAEREKAQEPAPSKYPEQLLIAEVNAQIRHLSYGEVSLQGFLQTMAAMHTGEYPLLLPDTQASEVQP